MEDNGDGAAGATAKERSAAPLAPTDLQARRQRALRAAASKHVPLPTIIVTIALVVVVYLAGKLLYILRESILLVLVAGFLALVLNPLVVAVQKKVRRRGLAVIVVSLWGVAVFAGFAVLFGRPLVGGVTQPGERAARVPEQGRARQGMGRGAGAQVPTRELGARQLVEAGDRGGKPEPAGVGGREGNLDSPLRARYHLYPGVPLPAGRAETQRGLLEAVPPERSARYQHLGAEISRSLSGYVLGDFLTSLVAGVVVFVTLEVLSVPYALIWAVWVALVDFLPSIGGALAGIPTVLFALTRSFTAAAITAVVFLVYQQVENRLLNPVIMSRTVKVNPLLVLVAVLIGADLGNWLGGTFAAFVAALLAIPAAGVVQVVAREIWSATSPEQPQAEEGTAPSDKLSGQ